MHPSLPVVEIRTPSVATFVFLSDTDPIRGNTAAIKAFLSNMTFMFFVISFRIFLTSSACMSASCRPSAFRFLSVARSAGSKRRERIKDLAEVVPIEPVYTVEKSGKARPARPFPIPAGTGKLCRKAPYLPVENSEFSTVPNFMRAPRRFFHSFCQHIHRQTVDRRGYEGTRGEYAGRRPEPRSRPFWERVLRIPKTF